MRVWALLVITVVAFLATTVASTAQRGGAGATPRGSSADRGEDGRAVLGRGIDAAKTRSGRLEYIVAGPISQSAVAEQVLTNAGALLIRARNLPSLDRRMLIFDLRRVTLEQARTAIAQPAPQTRIDIHHLYRFAAGKPRLYAAKLLGTELQDGCNMAGFRIGMIDGPVDGKHRALRAVQVQRFNALGRGERAVNTNHGTAVAALLAGRDPEQALSGYAPGAVVFAASAFAKEKRGPGADVERIGVALDWLAGQRVRLINMSFAGPSNTALDSLIAASTRQGTILVAAAGNGGQSRAVYPAASDGVIAVTAVDAAGRRYRSANTGRHIEFAAPGVDLYVAKRNGGTYASGTSYAAPIITALTARLMVKGVSSAGALRARMRKLSTDLGTPGRDTHYGWGLMRAPGC